MLIGESGDGMHSRDCKSKRGEGPECRGWDSVRHRIDHDLNGAPVSGATATYAAPSSGAGATLSTATAATNSSGIATVMATANFLAGM